MKPGDPEQYPTEQHLRRMAERSAARDIHEADSMAANWAGWVVNEAVQQGYA